MPAWQTVDIIDAKRSCSYHPVEISEIPAPGRLLALEGFDDSARTASAASPEKTERSRNARSLSLMRGVREVIDPTTREGKL